MAATTRNLIWQALSRIADMSYISLLNTWQPYMDLASFPSLQSQLTYSVSLLDGGGSG